jgi:tRNA-dihydrouridine synthase
MANPLIFREINSYMGTGIEWKPSAQEKIGCFFDYYNCCMEFGMVKMADIKLKAVQLTKGIDFTKQARVKIQEARTLEDVLSVLENFQQFIEEGKAPKEGQKVLAH